MWFYSDVTERVPGYLMLPDAAEFKGRRPVVIALHGTGGNKDGGQIVEILKQGRARGFIGVAIDGRFHGERTKAGTGAAEYNEAIARAFKTGEGHPFYYDTVWDVMRLIDYLGTRKDVDAKRIGLTGISKGGIETYFTAAADRRVAAAVPYIGVQSFKWALDNGAVARADRDHPGCLRCAPRHRPASPPRSVGFRARVLCARGAGHRREVRWSRDAGADRAAAAAGDQRGFGCEHADCRRAVVRARGAACV